VCGGLNMYMCSDEFIVSSEVQLRQLLVEFVDHHLIAYDKKGLTISLRVPITLLQQFLEEHHCL
jgi:hypothetical protein